MQSYTQFHRMSEEERDAMAQKHLKEEEFTEKMDYVLTMLVNEELNRGMYPAMLEVANGVPHCFRMHSPDDLRSERISLSRILEGEAFQQRANELLRFLCEGKRILHI